MILIFILCGIISILAFGFLVDFQFFKKEPEEVRLIREKTDKYARARAKTIIEYMNKKMNDSVHQTKCEGRFNFENDIVKKYVEKYYKDRGFSIEFGVNTLIVSWE